MAASFVCSGMRLIFEVKEIFRAESSADLDAGFGLAGNTLVASTLASGLKACFNAEAAEFAEKKS